MRVGPRLIAQHCDDQKQLHDAVAQEEEGRGGFLIDRQAPGAAQNVVGNHVTRIFKEFLLGEEVCNPQDRLLRYDGQQNTTNDLKQAVGGLQEEADLKEPVHARFPTGKPLSWHKPSRTQRAGVSRSVLARCTPRERVAYKANVGGSSPSAPTKPFHHLPRTHLKFARELCGSARISLGKEEVRCSGRKLFDGIQRVRLPPGKG